MIKVQAVFFSLMIFVVGCGGPKQVNLTPGAPKKIVTPEWFISPPKDGKFLYATVTETSRDMQMAISKSEAQARAELSRKMEAHGDALQKGFSQEIGDGGDSTILKDFNETYKIVSSQIMVGTSTVERELVSQDGIYRAYVLMSLPLGKANKQLLEQIRSQNDLYTELRATQAYKDLENEVAKLKD